MALAKPHYMQFLATFFERFFKQVFSIQIRMHLRRRGEHQIEAKRQRPTMAKRRIKRPRCKNTIQK